MTYKFYTDGAASLYKTNGNYDHGPGGWAWIQVSGDRVVACDNGRLASTTNQAMELRAIYEALSYAATACLDMGEADRAAVVIYSDSAYSIGALTQWCHNWVKNGWTRKGGKKICNLEIIQKIWGLMWEIKDRGVEIRFEKVRGHKGDRWNEEVDKLAVSAKMGGNF